VPANSNKIPVMIAVDIKQDFYLNGQFPTDQMTITSN